MCFFPATVNNLSAFVGVTVVNFRTGLTGANETQDNKIGMFCIMTPNVPNTCHWLGLPVKSFTRCINTPESLLYFLPLNLWQSSWLMQFFRCILVLQTLVWGCNRSSYLAVVATAHCHAGTEKSSHVMVDRHVQSPLERSGVQSLMSTAYL